MCSKMPASAGFALSPHYPGEAGAADQQLMLANCDLVNPFYEKVSSVADQATLPPGCHARCADKLQPLAQRLRCEHQRAAACMHVPVILHKRIVLLTLTLLMLQGADKVRGYFPQGTWVSLWGDHKRIDAEEGGRHVELPAPLGHIPLHVR